MDSLHTEKDIPQQPTAAEHEPKDEQTPAGRRLRGIPWILVVSSILTSTFLFGLDNTIVADVQPAIVGQFGSVSRLAWLSVAFLVGAASTTLFWSVNTSVK